MIIMIIAELSGRWRQSPIVLGEEGQSLGTKDTLSIGPLDTQWSHICINPVRCMLWDWVARGWLLSFYFFFFFAGVFADGPGAYLFHGVVEQQYVFHVMDYALCLSESKQKSCEKHVNRGGKPTSKSGALSLSVHSLYSLLLIAISYAVFVVLEA